MTTSPTSGTRLLRPPPEGGGTPSWFPTGALPRRGASLPAAWPLYALLYGYPLWWALGMQAFIWPVLALPMAAHLLAQRRRVVAVRGTGLLLLFLLWVLASATQLDSPRQLIAFTYRFSLYASAAVLLLFVVNLTRQQLPVARLARAVAFLWVVTVVGGFAGLALPGFSFTTPLEVLLPSALATEPFVQGLVHPELSSPSTLLGYDLPRPKAPFNYTNEWGSNYALLAPLAVYSALVVRSRWWRVLLAVLAVTSIVPVVISINRGLWLSLVVAAAYVAARAALRGRVRLLGGVLVGAAAVAVVVLLSPLGQVVSDRADRSNVQGRLYLYQEAARAMLESPVLGHGAPLPSDDPALSAGASVGTHGQLWTLLVSQGVPGLLLLLGFFLTTLLLTARVSRRALWAHATLVVVVFQLPFYNVLPMQLHVVVLAAALCWRDVLGSRWGSDDQDDDPADAGPDAGSSPARAGAGS